jgi:hypothetical protein
MMVPGEATVLGSVAIILANVVILLQNRKQSKKVDHVQETLTTPNGGTHVKDQLNRIEERQERVELHSDRMDRAILRLESKFDAHLLWSTDMSSSYGERIARLEGRNDNG